MTLNKTSLENRIKGKIGVRPHEGLTRQALADDQTSRLQQTLNYVRKHSRKTRSSMMNGLQPAWPTAYPFGGAEYVIIRRSQMQEHSAGPNT